MGLTSAALSLTATRAAQPDNAGELSRLRTERDTARRQLDTVRSQLHLQETVHETLARVAARGGGEDALTQALYELTGLSALIEDRFGNLRSWAVPTGPTPIRCGPRPTRKRCCGTSRARRARSESRTG